MAQRLALLLVAASLAVFLPARSAAEQEPAVKATSPPCAVMGTLLAVGLLMQAHEEHRHPAPVSHGHDRQPLTGLPRGRA